MITPHTFTISLTLQGPILTKSSSPSSFGVDAACARNFKGQLCIPGTHMEGKLRESLQLLGFSADDLLGKESPDGSNDEPSRGRLMVDDLLLIGTPSGGSARHRIAIDPTLGSVKHGALQVIESPFAAGEKATFEGKATCWGGPDTAADLASKLQASLRFLTHIGANRGIGFGRVLDASVTPLESPKRGASALAVASAYHLTLQVQGPLCISKHKIGGNLHESESTIPGNMIAGAIMQTAHSLGHTIDKALFNQVRFCHAHPAPESSPRPSAVPLSYVKAGGSFSDVASHSAPILISGIAPAFTGDWKPKDWGKANDAHHRHYPERELRVRTAIDYEHRTALKGKDNEGGSLFAWEVIHPTDGKKDLVWHGKIDLSAIASKEDQQKIISQLHPVLSHLGFLSKTKASATGTLTPIVAAVPTVGETLALVLQSRALLADPRYQIETAGAINATDMTQLYRSAWAQLSGGSLELSHHFSAQKLAGGGYLARRFQKGKAYNPYLLTTEGSVFVFKVKDTQKAKEKLKEWLSQNLPLPDWAIKAHGSGWQDHPYLPQNGFGEVAIHTSHPDFPTPTEAQVQPITRLTP